MKLLEILDNEIIAVKTVLFIEAVIKLRSN